MTCALCGATDLETLTAVHGVVLCQTCILTQANLARQLWLNPYFGFAQPAYVHHKVGKKSPAQNQPPKLSVAG